MKITRLSLFRLVLPLEHSYSLSGGRLPLAELDTTFVKMDTDAGVTGWGEGCPWGSTYLPAFPGGIRAGVEELAPAVLGLDPRRVEVVARAMDTALPGHLYVKSAVDVACWDILGKATDMPVCELLGGRVEEDVVVQSSIPTGTPTEMTHRIDEARRGGCRVHSAKIGSGVAEDIERITAIAAHVSPDESVTFDANRAWLPDEAIRVMNATRDVDAYFEQPCETYEECLAVRRATVQPIILDEVVPTFNDVVRAHADAACEAISLKLNRVGGLTKARRIWDFCVQVGLRMNIEETGGSALADTAAVHLAQATPASHRRATWLCHEMLNVDPVVGGARNVGGFTRAPEASGLGAEPDPDALGEPLAVYE